MLQCVRAVHAGARGEAVFGPRIADRVLTYFASGPQHATALVFPDLTAREREVLALMAEGRSNKAIAEALFVSENTVKTHSSRVFDKLGARRRTQAVQLGKQLRLIP